MRIGIYDPYLDTLSGGERYMLSIAECLAKENQVDVFWNDRNILKLAEEKLGINLKKVNTAENIFSDKVSFVKKIFTSAKYDVIFFLSDGSIPFVLSKKLIIHFQQPIKKNNIKSLGFKIKKDRIGKIICNSGYTKKYIDKIFKRDSTVLYPPVDFESFLSLNPQKKEDIILTVGRYTKLSNDTDFKKQSLLIEAFKDLVKNGLKGWEFNIAVSYLPQDEKNVDELEKRVKDMPVKILRNIDYLDLLKLYQKAKIYWHAAGFGEDLVKYPERAEHFGITTVEAMAACCVPVVIKAGGQEEIIEDNKNGFLWNDPTELKEKTMQLIKNTKLLYEISSKCQNIKLNFGKKNFCNTLKAILES